MTSTKRSILIYSDKNILSLTLASMWNGNTSNMIDNISYNNVSEVICVGCCPNTDKIEYILSCGVEMIHIYGVNNNEPIKNCEFFGVDEASRHITIDSYLHNLLLLDLALLYESSSYVPQYSDYTAKDAQYFYTAFSIYHNWDKLSGQGKIDTIKKMTTAVNCIEEIEKYLRAGEILDIDHTNQLSNILENGVYVDIDGTQVLTVPIDIYYDTKYIISQIKSAAEFVLFYSFCTQGKMSGWVINIHKINPSSRSASDLVKKYILLPETCDNARKWISSETFTKMVPFISASYNINSYKKNDSN